MRLWLPAGGGKRLISDDQQERLTTKLDLAALQDLCNHIAASVGSEERKLVALDMVSCTSACL